MEKRSVRLQEGLDRWTAREIVLAAEMKAAREIATATPNPRTVGEANRRTKDATIAREEIAKYRAQLATALAEEV